MTWSDALLAPIVLLLARQLFVLRAILRSQRFLVDEVRVGCEPPQPELNPFFYVVLPALREAAGLSATVMHCLQLLNGHSGVLIIVTTQREYSAGPVGIDEESDTVSVASRLSDRVGIVHLHYPDPTGIKADQLNYAVNWAIEKGQHQSHNGPAFFAFYDADSRPPTNSLLHFAEAIRKSPDVDVFHQSSRFEARVGDSARRQSFTQLLGLAFAESEALRANRFVLGFELPRLRNRLEQTHRLKRKLSRYVFAHVTGHGLCIRASLLQRMQFPPKSPLEDMHYSFLLCLRDMDMVPLRSLDVAEVPPTPRTQYEQLSRWFYGPGRWQSYLAAESSAGARAYVVSLSAAAISCEWLGCGFVPLLVVACATLGHSLVALLACTLIVVVAAQVVLTNWFLGRRGRGLVTQAAGILAFPFTMLLFGWAGIRGAINLSRGRSGVGRTVRSN